MSDAAKNVQWFIQRGCSCCAPPQDLPLPLFRCIGAESPDPARLLPVANDNIGWLGCKYCALRLQGVVDLGCCFACAKKKRLQIGTKQGTSTHTTTRWRAKERRDGLFVYGPIIPTRAYCMAASTQKNELRSLAMRQLSATPKVDDAMFFKLKAWVIENRHDIFPGLDSNICAFGPDADRLFDEWNRKFPKATRNANAKAWPQVKRDGLSARMLRKVSTIKLFLKSEKYDKADIGMVDPSLAPRCISSWCAYVNVATFCLSLFHEYLCKIWGDHTRTRTGALKNVCFPAGMNGEHLSAYFSSLMEEFGAAQSFEDDFTLFDSTQNARSHELLMLIYSWAGLDTWPNFTTIRRAQAGVCKGVTRHGVKYTDCYTMRSGSADTCLGNTIVNYLYHMFAIAYLNRVGEAMPSFRTTHDNVAMLVLGDDNVTLVRNGWTVAGVPSVLNSLGLISKLTKRDRPNDCVFLNQWFIHMGGGEYRCMPNFFRLFGKIGYSCDEQPDPSAYQYEIARAFQASFSCCTVPSEAIRHLMEVAGSRSSPQNKGCNKKRTTTMSHAVRTLTKWKNLAVTGTLPTPTSDADFRRRCGPLLSAETQPSVLRQLTSYRSVPCALGGRALAALVVGLT